MTNTVFVSDINDQGYGISKLSNGKVAFIYGALLNETVCAEIINEKKDYSICRVVDIISASNERVVPFCSNYYKCGGCSLMHMSYESQLAFKVNLFNSKIKAINPDVNVLLPINSLDRGYRRRVRFTYRVKGKNVQLFFSENKALSKVPISSCPVCDLKLNDFILSPPIINSWELNNFQLPCISTDKGVLYQPNEIGCISIKTEKMGVKKLFVSNQVFFQSNLLLLPSLIDLVCTFIEGETVLDLYGGVGTFSSFLEDKFKVTCVEINKDCLSLASLNLKHSDSRFITSPVEKLNPSDFKADSVIVDPPRSGLDLKVFSFISRVSPKAIIYVSCYLPTLLRDLSILKEKGYTLKTAVMLDFYPHTPHLECVVMMSRNK